MNSVISKLTFENIADGARPNTFNDNNKNSTLKWSAYSSFNITTNSGHKEVNIRHYNNRIQVDHAVVNSDIIKNTDFEVETNLRINQLKNINGCFAITKGWANYISFFINNKFINGFEVVAFDGSNVNNVKAGFNFKFEENVDYNIIISKVDNYMKLYINGMIIGSVECTQLINYTPTTNDVRIMFGATNSNQTADHLTNGDMWNMNTCFGVGVKNGERNAITKYGDNLVSRLNFDNLQSTSSEILFTSNLEAIPYAVSWDYDETKVNKYNVNTTFTTNIDTNFTALIKMSNNKNRTDVGLITYGNYKVTYNYISIGEPEPSVVVDAYTKSALEFENGLIDKIDTTVWNKEGTASVTNVNKIFGDNSFETKALGDTLYTSSKVINGLNTPFTIEFYGLISGYDSTITTAQYIPLFMNCDNNNNTQEISRHKTNGNLIYFSNSQNGHNIISNKKINLNEINKITLSYDTACLRVFVNNELECIIGQSNYTPFINYTLFNNTNNFVSDRRIHKGLIDNINIFDGVAKKVRDYDEYEDNLIVDLAFDGENNSTKIVDNGNLKSNWNITGNVKISTDKKFDGYSSLFFGQENNIRKAASNVDALIQSNIDFTLSFMFSRLSSSTHYETCISTGVTNITTATNVWTINVFGNSYPNTNFPNLRNKISLLNEKNFNNYSDGLISNMDIFDNVEYKVTFVKKNGIVYLYINDILDSQTDKFKNNDIDFSNMCIGSTNWATNQTGFSGYIKNIKLYRDVAIIPESPVGKIQLDFDNNLNDNYNNSTWSNTGVTFDQVNSVKGYAIKLEGDTKALTTNSPSLNFENKNFDLQYDIKPIDVGVGNRYAMTNSLTSSSTGSIWMAASHYLGFDYFEKPLNSAPFNLMGIVTNTYYNQHIFRTGSNIFVKYNDVISGSHNLTTQVFNMIGGGLCAIGKAPNFNSGLVSTNAYIDNFKSIKDYQGTNIIDKAAIHLPLETNSNNIGFTPLVVQQIGTPVYHVVDNKKCSEFIAGRYISINNHNIFNMGTESDFYFECMFYTSYRHTNSFGQTLINNGTDNQSNGGMWFQINTTQQLDTGHISIAFNNQTLATTSEPTVLSAWNKLVFKRKNKEIFLILNDVITKVPNFDVHFSKGGSFTIGQVIGASTNATFDGQICDIKMFVGTSEIPETYNDKKVLDLNFEPTRKSYLFKDKNNKCVIHPVNISQRDYQDSQYCCTFNGSDQYLQLGKNDLFNFGLDDFVINYVFKPKDVGSQYFVLLDNDIPLSNNTNDDRIYVTITPNTASFPRRIEIGVNISNSWYQIRSDVEILSDKVCNLIIKQDNKQISMIINGELQTQTMANANINLNSKSNNTFIGSSKWSGENFKGQIYSIKVLRNTTDLTLLDEVASRFEESFTLSNGTNSQTIINDVKKDNHNIRFIKDTDKSKLIIDGEFIEVPSVENASTELKLFENYNSEVKDVKLYNTVFEDEDIFLGNEPIDTVFGEIEYNEESEYELDIPEGDYTLKGFIEGYTDRDFFIYNTLLDYEIYRGTEYYDVNFMDEYSLDEYEINDLVTGAKYPVLKHEMIRGYISGTVNLKGCGVAAKDMKVYCYRDDTHRLIGIYSVDETGKYNIPNLDVNSKYDIIFKDETRKIKDQISNYRTPKVY